METTILEKDSKVLDIFLFGLPRERHLQCTLAQRTSRPVSLCLHTSVMSDANRSKTVEGLRASITEFSHRTQALSKHAKTQRYIQAAHAHSLQQCALTQGCTGACGRSSVPVQCTYIQTASMKRVREVKFSRESQVNKNNEFKESADRLPILKIQKEKISSILCCQAEGHSSRVCKWHSLNQRSHLPSSNFKRLT